MKKVFGKEYFETAYNGKKVLIIGNTGFKGSWLSLWLLMLGADVYGYALEPFGSNSHFSILKLNSKMHCVYGDIRNLDKLCEVMRTVKPEYVFHLAAQAIVRTSFKDAKETFDVNVGGSVNVLEAVRAADSVKSLIYVTSDKCYKNKEWLWGYREIDELGGIDPYSASKACAELVFSSYKQCFFDGKRDMGISSVRAGNVIGGGDWSDDRIVPDCIKALLSESPMQIRNPNSTRPWQHVLEPLSGYLILATMQYKNHTYSDSWNFGPQSGSSHTVEELVQEIITLWGVSSNLYNNNNNNNNNMIENPYYETNFLKVNSDKAHQGLNWKSRWDFEETVKETVDWYKAYSIGDIISEEQIEKYMYECV